MLLYYLEYIDEKDSPQCVYYDQTSQTSFMEMLYNSSIYISKAKTNDPAYKEDKFVEFDENLKPSPLREEYERREYIRSLEQKYKSARGLFIYGKYLFLTAILI